jgi:multidrug efflux pump subunit AcrA (membrane-fusion protein)
MEVKKGAKFVGLILVVVLVIWWLFFTGGEKVSHTVVTGVRQESPAQKGKKERKIKYWVAPMDPTYIRDRPGKSPMGMDLVPVYEDEEPTAEGVIRIDPVTIQDIGVRTTKVTKGPLTAEVRTVGRVTYNEERVEHVHTRVSGWVEQLFVSTTGQAVHKGEKLLTIYSPDLVATQEEYLQALRYARQTEGSSFKDISNGGKALIDATKRRLLLMDIRPGQIEALEKRGEVQNAMVLYSSTNGIVIDKKVLAGMRVTPGTELYTIADLSNVWIIGSIYEYELPFVKNGQEAEITLPYDPGIAYKGRISFIYPYLSAETRTVQVRIDFRNPGLRLKPDMFVDVSIKSRLSKDVLQVPSDAVIRTGTRNIVIAVLGGGKFLPKEVELGPEGQGMVRIKSGLREGEMVVASGQFLIDSESNLKQAMARMEEAPPKSTAVAKSGTPAVRPVSKPPKEEETPPALEMNVSKEQQGLMSGIIEAYLKIHEALIADAITRVATEANILSDLVQKLRMTASGANLDRLTSPMTESLKGLQSGNLKEARNAFVPLSRALVAYVKGPGRKEAHESGLRIFYCPMKKEPWLQEAKSSENPYLGKEMLLCGNEIKY